MVYSVLVLRSRKRLRSHAHAATPTGQHLISSHHQHSIIMRSMGSVSSLSLALEVSRCEVGVSV